MNRKIGVVLSYVMMIFEVLSTLLLTPFIIRTLGQAEYGVYKLVSSVTAYLLLLDLGVGNAVTRYIAKYRTTNDKNQEERFFGVAIVYYSLIAIATIIIGCILIVAFPKVFAKGLTQNEISLAQKLLWITILNAAVTLGTSVFNNVIIAYERFAVAKGISIIQIIVRMILTALAITGGFGSFGILLVNLLMTVFGRLACVLYVCVKIKLIPHLKGVNKEFVKEVTAYSSLIFLQMIATQINSYADQIMLGSLVTSSASIIAVYSVGTQIVQYFKSIGGSVNGVLMPGIVSMVEHGADGEELTKEMIRIGRIIFMVIGIIFFGFVVFGKDFIILWAGKINEEAYVVALLLLFAQLLILSKSVGQQILWALNQHKEQSILKLIIVLLNIILTIILISWQPLLGATIGTFISLFIGDIVLMDFVFVKKIKFSVKKYYAGLFKGILPCLLIAMLAGFLFKSFVCISGWVSLIFGIAVVLIVYFIAMILLGLNEYEKNMFVNTIKSMTGKIRK